MRINRPNTKPESVEASEVDDAEAAPETKELNASVYKDAMGYIDQAIKSLGAYARRVTDSEEAKFAKEEIANLSVVRMEMLNHTK